VPAAVAPPPLQFGGLYGTFTVASAPADRLDVEDTPGLADETDFTNSAGGPPDDLAVMGSHGFLRVTGDYAVSVGRRLHADGTVEQVGQVGGLQNYLPGASGGDGRAQMTFTYTGPGTTSLVFDESNDTQTIFGGTFQRIEQSGTVTNFRAALPAVSSPFLIHYGPNVELFDRPMQARAL